MKTYKNINRATLSKGKKKVVAVVTRFDDESIQAFKYAVDTFGIDTKYILLSIYSFENAMAATTASPEMVRSEMIDKLTSELRAVRTELGNIQPEIAIQFEFGSNKQVLEQGWRNKEFELVVIPNSRPGLFGMSSGLPSRQVPILIPPESSLVAV